MRTLAVALSVTIAITGILLAIAGWRGALPQLTSEKGRNQAAPKPSSTPMPWVQVGGASAAFVVTLWLSRWPVAAVGAAAMVWMIPMFAATSQRRELASRRAEAVASWTEMLADTVASGSGLRSALVTTARVAPSPIRREVRVLAARSETMQLSDALRLFAAEMSSATADLVVAALLISHEHAAGRLRELLVSASHSTRQQVSMQRRVETTRAKTYASARMMVIIGVTVLVLLVLFRPPFVDAFDTAFGQLMLLIVVGLFVGGVWSLLKMGEPMPRPRVLRGIEAQP